MLYNEQTGELRRFIPTTRAPEGKWMLRRPLTLSESSKPLFLTIRFQLHHPAKGSVPAER
jgi:hypothetical protein